MAPLCRERRTTMMKGLRKRLVALGCLVAMTTTSLGLSVPVSAEDTFSQFTDTYESAVVGKLPEGYVANYSEGKVAVEDYSGNKVIAISKSGDGKLSMLTRNFAKITDVGMEVSFDFRQKSVKTDGATVIALANDGKELAKLETENGNISYKNASGTYETVVSNYLANKWYSFTINADLKNGTVSVSVGGKTVLRNVSFTNAGNSCDSVYFATKFSPGFAIDNLSVKDTKSIDKIQISGDDKITVPVSGENEYTYTATVLDSYGNADATATVNWEISPGDVPGIYFNTDSNTAKVTLSDSVVYSGVITLTASSAADASVRTSTDILVVDSVISELEISGEPKLAYGLKDDNKFTYTYKMYDQYGVLQNNEPVTYKIKEKTDEVSVNADGVVTVLKPITDEKHVTLVVTYTRDKNISAEKILTLMDLETYKNDEARLNILRDAATNVIAYATDMYGDTPLLASQINLHTGKSPIYKNMSSETYSVMSNMTQETALFRAFDAISILTGDDTYTNKVDEIYQWYLDNGINEYNMGNWGGHIYINLLTGKEYKVEGNENTHELKNSAFYMEPFFRLDSDRAYSLVKTMWGGHIGSEERWKDLIANRHAYVDSARGPAIAPSTAFWDQPDVFDDTSKEWVRDNANIPFRSISDDLATVAAIAYKETGDETAKTWAFRILNQMYKLRNEDTKIVPNTFVTARGAKNVPDKNKEDPEWWKKTNGEMINDGTKYGDRFFRQFAENGDIVNQGFYDASALDPNDTRLLDGYYFSNSDHFETPVIHDLQVAKALGVDTPEGQAIRRIQTENVAAYLKYAWQKGTKYVYPIMADGTNLSGFKPTRNGYYGDYYTNKGTMKKTTAGIGLFPSVCACYDIARNDKTLAEEEAIYWEYLQFFPEFYGLGKFGTNEIGDEGMDLNYATTASDPSLLMAVVDIYYATGRTEFLTLARRIAENMISTYYKYGIFVDKSNTGINVGQAHIVRTGDVNSVKYYSLCYLEAAIRGEKDLIPEYYPWDSYVEGYYEYNVNHQTQRTYINQVSDANRYNAVEATDIIIDEVIYLKKGETKKLEYKVLPDDVTSSSIVCESEDKSIVRVNKDDLSLVGVKPGKANLIVCSNEFNIIKNVTVIVSEEE